jgi:hypothetical protein
MAIWKSPYRKKRMEKKIPLIVCGRKKYKEEKAPNIICCPPECPRIKEHSPCKNSNRESVFGSSSIF